MSPDGAAKTRNYMFNEERCNGTADWESRRIWRVELRVHLALSTGAEKLHWSGVDILVAAYSGLATYADREAA